MTERVVTSADWPRIDLEQRAALIQRFGSFDAAKAFSGSPSKVYPFTPHHAAAGAVRFWREALGKVIRASSAVSRVSPQSLAFVEGSFFINPEQWRQAMQSSPFADRVFRTARAIETLERGFFGSSAVTGPGGVSCLSAESTGGFWDRTGRIAIELQTFNVAPVTVDQFWVILVQDAPVNIKAAAKVAAEKVGEAAAFVGETAGQAIKGFAAGVGVPALIFIAGVGFVALR